MIPRRPVLVSYARYRWDALRGQHQLVFPEGMLVLNDTAAAVVSLCDGRSLDAIIAVLQQSVDSEESTEVKTDVCDFLDKLVRRGLLDDSADS